MKTDNGISIVLNGAPHAHRGDGSIRALLVECGAHPERVALVVNQEVAPRTQWERQHLREGDRVEILVLAGGG